MTDQEKKVLVDKIRRKGTFLTAAGVNQAEIIIVEVVEIIKNFQSENDESSTEKRR